MYLAEQCAPARSVLPTLNHGARWKSLRVCFRQGLRFRVHLGNSTLQRREDVAGGVSPGTRVVQCAAGERPGRGEANIVLELEEGEIRDSINTPERIANAWYKRSTRLPVAKDRLAWLSANPRDAARTRLPACLS